MLVCVDIWGPGLYHRLHGKRGNWRGTQNARKSITNCDSQCWYGRLAELVRSPGSAGTVTGQRDRYVHHCDIFTRFVFTEDSTEDTCPEPLTYDRPVSRAKCGVSGPCGDKPTGPSQLLLREVDLETFRRLTPDSLTRPLSSRTSTCPACTFGSQA